MRWTPSGARTTFQANLGKLCASATSMRVDHWVIKFHVRKGCSKELPVERYFGDARIAEPDECSNQIQRRVIRRLEPERSR